MVNRQFWVLDDARSNRVSWTICIFDAVVTVTSDVNRGVVSSNLTSPSWRLAQLVEHVMLLLQYSQICKITMMMLIIPAYAGIINVHIIFIFRRNQYDRVQIYS